MRKVSKYVFFGGGYQLFVNIHLSQGFLELNPQGKRGMTLLVMKGRGSLYSTCFISRGVLKNASVWSWVCEFHTIVWKDTCYFTQHYLRIGYYNEYGCVLCEVQPVFVHIITQTSDHTSASWLNKQLVSGLSLRRTRLNLVQSGWDLRQRGTGLGFRSEYSGSSLPLPHHQYSIFIFILVLMWSVERRAKPGSFQRK
jgi:hypothetical protein